MMLFSVLLAALAFFASSVVLGAGLPVAGGLLVKHTAAEVLASSGHTISTVQYTGKIGQNDINFNGTIEELLDHVEAKNPGFNRSSLLVSGDSVATRDLEVRTQDGMLCCPVAGQSFAPAYWNHIQQGAQYLQGLGGSMTIGAAGTNNGGNCGRISCSYDSAIYLCNDNGYPMGVDAAHLGSFAFDLLHKCAIYPLIGATKVCGQEFDTEHFNVFVAHDNC